jgi:heptosyltransferase-2
VHEFKKILVIRFSSLGDVILTTPLLKTLRNKFPQSEIHYCVYTSYSDILKYNPNIDRIIAIEDKPGFRKLRALKKEIIQNRYVLILDAHNNLRTFYLKLFMPGRVESFKKYSLRKFLLVKFKINLMRHLPQISQRYLSMPDGDGTYKVPEIFTDEQSKASAEKILRGLEIKAGTKLIGVIPSARHFTKTYPPEYYSELLNKFDSNKFSFVLAGKGADRKQIDIIKQSTGSNVYDLCDRLNLLELAELMRRCQLVITGDTGPMHIAEALDIPLALIAGSSVREFGFFPSSENSIVIENEGLKCRPCTHIGRDSCPLGHFKCMRELTPEKLYKKILEMPN